MNRLISALLLLLALSACKPSQHSDAHGHAHGPGNTHGHHEEEAARGPNGGRLLSEDGFTVELAVFEDGVPPEYRAWITRKGEPLAPETVKLSVQLSRLDGEINRYAFMPQGAFLRGDGVVAEPHSFSVTVSAAYEGRVYGWQYDSFEGRVTIPDASAQAAGIAVEAAGPQRIREVLPLYGRIALKPEAQREVRARFAGRIVSVARNIGDTVKSGEVLAGVESDDSLQVYAVTAPIAGTVTARRAQPGEQAGSEALFAISDLTQVRAELSAFPRDLAALAVGQEVRLRTTEGAQTAQGRIERIAPVANANGGAVTVWATLDAAWTPGLFVNAEVTTGGADVALAVKASALQAFRDFTVAFAKVGETYEVRMLELGRRDGEYVEVLGGLKPGTDVVVQNSYLIKADIEKSGASHDH